MNNPNWTRSTSISEMSDSYCSNEFVNVNIDDDDDNRSYSTCSSKNEEEKEVGEKKSTVVVVGPWRRNHSLRLNNAYCLLLQEQV